MPFINGGREVRKKVVQLLIVQLLREGCRGILKSNRKVSVPCTHCTESQGSRSALAVCG